MAKRSQLLGGGDPGIMLTMKSHMKKRGRGGTSQEKKAPITTLLKQEKKNEDEKSHDLQKIDAEEGSDKNDTFPDDIEESVGHTSDFTPLNERAAPRPVSFTPINNFFPSSSTRDRQSESPVEKEEVKNEKSPSPPPSPPPPPRRVSTPRRKAVKEEPTESNLDTLDSNTPKTPSRSSARKRKEPPTAPITPTPKRSKKQLGQSPFPDHPHPTAQEAHQIATLLRNTHGPAIRPPILQPSLTVTGCGEVPLILDALIRTIISANTSIANSAIALAGIVKAFGSKDGTINYDSIHERSVEDLEEAMRRGGLAGVKSKSIKAILKEAADESIKIGQPDTPLVLSLEHLRPLPTQEIMAHLMSYKGVGVKIAACVVLFCLQRPCLAIDTHCYRMARFLGWIPEKANADETFFHLDAVVPDELKYELHELFMKHGQSCGKCSREGPTTEEGKKRKEDKKKEKKGKDKAKGKGGTAVEPEEDSKEKVGEAQEETGCVLEEFVKRVWLHKSRAKKVTQTA